MSLGGSKLILLRTFLVLGTWESHTVRSCKYSTCSNSYISVLTKKLLYCVGTCTIINIPNVEKRIFDCVQGTNMFREFAFIQKKRSEWIWLQIFSPQMMGSSNRTVKRLEKISFHLSFVCHREFSILFWWWLSCSFLLLSSKHPINNNLSLFK
jgi:hypothetical protein